MSRGARLLARLKALRPSAALLERNDVSAGITLGIGALVGGVIVVFILITEALETLLVDRGLPAPYRYATPVLAALAVGLLLTFVFPGARGGIQSTKAALVAKGGRIPFRDAVGRFVCSALSLGAGIPLGREGPAIQIGAGISSTVGRALGVDADRQRQFVPVGAAAALAAAFNTPIAAVLFSLEEIVGQYHARFLGPAVLSAAAGWLVLRLSLGDEPLFAVPEYALEHPLELLVYVVLGLLGGLVSVLFLRLLLGVRARFRRLPARSRWLHPALGAVAVAGAWALLPGLFHVGYGPVGDALAGRLDWTAMLALLVLHLVLSVVAYASGNAGGIFGPSIFIGAMLGGVVGSLAGQWFEFAGQHPGPYALVGMGALIAGVMRTPMASVFMIFEITQSYAVIVPLMIANLASFFVSRRLQPVRVFHALARQDDIRLPEEEDVQEPPVVRMAMRPPSETLPPDLTVEDAIERVVLSARRTWPVAEGDRLVGVISLSELERCYRGGEDQRLLREVVGAKGEFPHVFADMPIGAAISYMGSIRMDALPVVSRMDVHRLEAVVSVNDLLHAYGIGLGHAAEGPPSGLPG